MSTVQITNYRYWLGSGSGYDTDRLSVACFNGWQNVVGRGTIASSSDVRRITSVTFVYYPYFIYSDNVNGNLYVDFVLQISSSDSQFINANGAQGSSAGRVSSRLYGKNVGEFTGEVVTLTFPEPIILEKNTTYYLWSYPANYTNSGNGVQLHSCQCEYDSTVPASTINVSNTLYMNNQTTISWTPYVSGCTYKVSYKFTSSGTTTVINNSVSGSSVSYTFPTSLSSLIPNSISGTLTIYVDTYNGSTLVGQYSSDFSLSIPTSGRAPTCASGWASASYEAVISRCLAGRSDIKATVDKSKITTNYNATIQSIWATCNAASQNFTESGTKTLTKAIAGSNVVTVSVADSRGITTSTSFTITGEAYSPPSFSSLSVIRCNSSATESSSGTYYAVTPNVTFNSFSGANTLTIKTRWKISGGSYSGYTTISNGVKSSALGEGHILTDSSYIIEVYAYDTVGGSSTQTRTLTNTSVAATINLKSNGLGVCIGGYATQDKCFEIKNSEGWKSVISTGMYGSSLPSSGVEGQIFFKQSNLDYATYDSVTKLGQTNGSALISNTFLAMPDHSILICDAAQFSSSDVPTIYGTIELVRFASYRGWVMLYGKGHDSWDFRRNIYADGLNLPWYRIFEYPRTSTWDRSGIITFDSAITPSWDCYWRQLGPFVYFDITGSPNTGSNLVQNHRIAYGFPVPYQGTPFFGMNWGSVFLSNLDGETDPSPGTLHLSWRGDIVDGQNFNIHGMYVTKQY